MVTEEDIDEVDGENDIDEFSKYFKKEVQPKIMVRKFILTSSPNTSKRRCSRRLW